MYPELSVHKTGISFCFKHKTLFGTNTFKRKEDFLAIPEYIAKYMQEDLCHDIINKYLLYLSFTFPGNHRIHTLGKQSNGAM